MAEDAQNPAPDDGPEQAAKDLGEEALAALDAEVAKWKDQAMRARADYQNLQKRVERDAALERERVRARVLEHFLQVYEYGRMAATEAEKSPGALAEGVKMVQKEFDRLLDLEGVVRVGEVGERFDNARHEAVGEEPAEGVAPGHISRVVAPGYLLGERVLRYARVVVQPGDASNDVPEPAS